MKKQILAVIALCAVSCCLAACNSVSYDDLNSKLDLNYSKIHLAITNKYDKETSLRSDYHMEFSDGQIIINYYMERFTEISLDNPSAYTKPEQINGTAIIKDGAVVSGDIDISVLPNGLDFKEEYFENAKLTKSNLFADVKNASAFLGTEITCTDMKVSAFFGEAFNSITVTYKSQSGNSVEYLYEFGALA